MDEMRNYGRLKNFILFFLVFYFLAGLATEVVMENREKDIPPLFSWFLFSKVPNGEVAQQHAVRILEYNGKELKPPVFFDKAYGIVDLPNSPKARELIRDLGRRLETGQDSESERLRQLLEKIYLPTPIRYEVVRARYKPLERFKTGEYEEIVPIGEFQSYSL